MIKVVICGDDAHFLDEVEKMLRVYEKKTGSLFSIKKIDQSSTLMEVIHDFQIYFFDLKRSENSGFELAKTIHIHDERAIIIFITAYPEYVFGSFQFDISNYIMKPITQIQIDCEMNRIIRKLQTYEQEFLVVKNSNGLNKIYLSEVEYIETYDRKVMIHCRDGRNETGRFKLRDLEERLKKYPFIRCHNSYIVNVDYIRQIQGLSVKLLSGEIIYTTKYRKKDLIKKMAEREGLI